MTASQQSFSVPLILTRVSDVADQATKAEITQITFAIRTLALALDAYTGAQSPNPIDFPSQTVKTILGNNYYKFYAVAGTAITYGAVVNFTALTATQVQARPAKADSASTAAMGFCIVPGGVAAGSWGEFVVGSGVNIGLSGLTPGAWYWLSPTSTTGQITLTKPTTVGQIEQLCGWAATATSLVTGSLNNWKQL